MRNVYLYCCSLFYSVVVVIEFVTSFAIMDGSGFDTKECDNIIEFISVKEENIWDIRENHRGLKEEITAIGNEENAIYLKTEDEVNVYYECQVSGKVRSLGEEAIKNSSDILMCEDEDPLSSLPCVVEDNNKICSSEQVKYKKVDKTEKQEKVDTDEKGLLCQICKKQFRCRSKLLVHMRVHTKDKPYRCEECGKTYSQKCHLMEHMKVHTNEKHYVCEIWSKSFSWRSFLVKHMGIHTKEKLLTVKYVISLLLGTVI